MTKFRIGDLVTFAEKDNAHWQGGKARVTEIGTGNYPVRVKLIEGPPLNSLYKNSTSEFSFAENGLEFWVDETQPVESSAVEHPSHYGGKDNPYEVIKVAEAWGFDKDAYLFNVLKYIARAGKKGATLDDHKKASFYLNRKIKQLENA